MLLSSFHLDAEVLVAQAAALHFARRQGKEPQIREQGADTAQLPLLSTVNATLFC